MNGERMEPKISTETVHIIEHRNLDKFLTERFKFKEHYEFIAAEEMSKGNSRIINVGKEKLSKWDKRELEKMITTKQWGCYSAGILLCHLCDIDEIPEGKYVIDASW